MTSHTLESSDDWSASVCVPSLGSGTLAALGNVRLLVGSTDPAAVGPLLAQAQQVAASGGQGRQLVRTFALLLSTSGDVAPFVALAPHSTGLAVLVQGDEASVTIGGETISGADSLAWVERLIPWPVADLEAKVDGGAVASGGLFRLTEGVVPAGGFTVSTGIAGDLVDLVEDSVVLPDAPESPVVSSIADEMVSDVEPAAEPTPAPPPPPPAPADPTPAPPPPAPAPPPPAPDGRPQPAPLPDQQVSFDSVLLDDIDDEPAPAPLPIVGEAPAAHDHAHAPEEVGEQVRGVFCKNRHFNDPRQLFCAVCGINMVQQTPVLVNGTRPPLGTIVLDDGAVFQLDSDYLIGRDPESDERVRSGSVRGVPVQDTSNQISRIHARLELRGWDVVVIDNASTNGTFVSAPQNPGWQRLPSGGEHVLVQGTRVRVGHRTLAFNTHAAT